MWVGAPAGGEGSIKPGLAIGVNDKFRLFRWDTKGGISCSYYFSGFLDSTSTDYLMSGKVIWAAAPLFGLTIEFPIEAKLFYRVCYPAGGKSERARAVVYYSYYLREGRLECIIFK